MKRRRFLNIIGMSSLMPATAAGAAVGQEVSGRSLTERMATRAASVSTADMTIRTAYFDAYSSGTLEYDEEGPNGEARLLIGPQGYRVTAVRLGMRFVRLCVGDRLTEYAMALDEDRILRRIQDGRPPSGQAPEDMWRRFLPRPRPALVSTFTSLPNGLLLIRQNGDRYEWELDPVLETVRAVRRRNARGDVIASAHYTYQYLSRDLPVVARQVEHMFPWTDRAAAVVRDFVSVAINRPLPEGTFDWPVS